MCAAVCRLADPSYRDAMAASLQAYLEWQYQLNHDLPPQDQWLDDDGKQTQTLMQLDGYELGD